MSEIKLLPCPFCGEWKKIELKPFLKNKWYVECSSCFSAAFFSDSEEEAVKAWNTRKPIDDIVEQIQQKKCRACRNILGTKDAERYCEELKCEVYEIIKLVRGGRE